MIPNTETPQHGSFAMQYTVLTICDILLITVRYIQALLALIFPS